VTLILTNVKNHVFVVIYSNQNKSQQETFVSSDP